MSAYLDRLRPFLVTFRQALRFVWDSSHSLTVASLVVRILQGLLPLVVLYLTKL